MADGRSVLVNFVYCHPVGHAIEALHYCHGIAGNLWPEYYFNGVPFYSVLPDLRRFPAYTGLGPAPEPVDDDGPRSPSMCRERIKADLDEITEGAARLIERRWPAEEATADHVSRMLALRGGDGDRIWSVDAVHRKYLNRQN